MFLFKLNFYPADAGGGTAVVPDTSTKELTKDDILDALNADDDVEAIPLKDGKKEEVKEEEAKEDDDEESDDEDLEDVDELTELEEELEEPGEEKLELTNITSRREILKKYPKIFKEFPGLETAYYREREFSKHFPTVADAKEAVEAKSTLDNFEKDLMSGNTEDILKAVKTQDTKSFHKIVDNYMTALSKVDGDAYQHVIGNTIKHVIMAMVDEARSSQNEPLQEAAAILNQFMFASSKFSPPSKLVTDSKPEDNEHEKKLSEREQNFNRQRFESASNELQERVDKVYKTTIDTNIDPKKTMSDYVRKQASRDASEELSKLMAKDSRFKSIVDKLWDRAIKDGYSSESMGKLRSAFASKAQTLLPAIIKKARNEALRGMGKRVVEDDDSRPEKSESKNGSDSNRRESKKGGESHRRNDSGKSGKVPAGMSSYEYLMSDD